MSTAKTNWTKLALSVAYLHAAGNSPGLKTE
jgi:hypothetical protein